MVSTTDDHCRLFIILIQRSILVLDEVDQLCSDASLFSDLVKLSHTHSECLRIIGIANTHTLTANNSTQADDAHTLHFSPYTSAELSSILTARLSPLTSVQPSFISPSTVFLASRKVASMSGDVRLLLSTFSRAIDASANANQTSVNPAHVLQAIQKDKASASSSNGHIQAIRGMGLQGRLVLITLILALRRASSGLSITPSTSPTMKKALKSSASNFSHISLHSYYASLLRASPITALSRVDFSDVLSSLEVNGLILISLSHARGEKGRSSISLVSGVQEGELLRGLFGDESKKHENAKEIWETESLRIIKLAARATDVPHDVFEEASQR